MAKKAKQSAEEKVVLGRRKPTTPPRKIGGVSESIKLDWGKIGRRKIDDEESLMQLAVEVKAAREAKGLSIGQLARKLDVAPATIIKFEDRGYPVSIKVVNGMAMLMGYKLQLVEQSAAETKKK